MPKHDKTLPPVVESLQDLFVLAAIMGGGLPGLIGTRIQMKIKRSKE